MRERSGLVGGSGEETHTVLETGLMRQSDHAAALMEVEESLAEFQHLDRVYAQLRILALMAAQTALEERLKEPPTRVARDLRADIGVAQRRGRDPDSVDEVARYPTVAEHGQVIAIDR